MGPLEQSAFRSPGPRTPQKDRLDATGVPGAVSNYQTYAQWAFVTYKPTENTSARVGRQRFAIFTASEFVNNHAELPYREIPAIVYKTAPFSTFDGASIQQVFDIGIGKLSAGVFGGTPLIDYVLPSFGSASFNSLLGPKLTLDGEGWRIRLQGSWYVAHAEENLSVINATLPDLKLSGTSSVYSVGYRFDKYNFVSWGEYVVTTSNNGTNTPTIPGFVPGGNFAGSAEAGYVLLGYRINKFLPRYTFASANESIGVLEGQTISHTLGLNYSFNENVTGKIEFEYDKIPAPNTGFSVSQTASSTATSANALYAGVDFKF